MKNLYISLGFLIATTSLSAQSKETEQADKLFGRFEYVDAAKEYLKLAKKGKDPYVYKQLAESYFNVYNSKEAAVWYKKAIDAKQQDAETYYRYAQMLKANGNYEEYNAQMKVFAKMTPKDSRAVAFNEDPDYLPKLKSQTKMFDEKILDINDKEYGSFGAVLANDGTLYFTSNRNTSRKTYGRDEQPYLDIYTATYNADGSISEPTTLGSLNTQYHDGPVALSADGNTMYFASESFREGDAERGKGQKTSLIYLYKATKENGKWGNVLALPFNNKAWSTNCPSISKDGKWLYFSSDRKGTVGGSDIWKVEIKGGNSYGEPINLGKKINTPGREAFPFITDDNKLFFSSDGHKGLGGLDVFYADLTKEGSDAVNVGPPVNSAADDFSFSLNQQKNIGFFSSNRAGKKGDQMGNVDNMYKAIPICGVDAVVTVKDKKTGQVIKAASVAILDEKNNVIETRTTDNNGVVSYSVDCNKGYALVATAADYEKNTFALPAQNGGKKDIVAELVPLESMIVGDRIVLKDIYFDFDKSNITQKAAEELDKLVQLMKSKPNLVIMVKAHTDTKGSAEYNMRLSNERAISAVQYVLSNGIAKERISGQGYGKSEPRIVCEPCTAEQDAENRRIEFIIVKGL
ncbi:cell envelope biogenesis protein OmpA [Flavobacterium akiainvivens]|uniref:Cell envelope biogenesis protein OmpA n=1 Tax=Flavobacterium akiainvivens TaxID=1202724 RepID=A0A0M8MAY3_9FLAO|nr:OmpA family protein [Flavobacterium akiainvivens]KOS07303.1 cell envelope biogenesis protein OmpA [Flavobacterium akiainvivens]SFQ46436.1 Outer membrane protein OmpA [Flavobacterium akiainvivens]